MLHFPKNKAKTNRTIQMNFFLVASKSFMIMIHQKKENYSNHRKYDCPSPVMIRTQNIFCRPSHSFMHFATRPNFAFGLRVGSCFMPFRGERYFYL